MSFAVCTSEGRAGAHIPLLLYAGSPNLEIPVQAWQGPGGYELSDFNADGIKGVSATDLVEAECDDEPICADCMCLVDHWEHS